MKEVLRKPLFLRCFAALCGLLLALVVTWASLTTSANDQLLKESLRAHGVTLAEAMAKATSHLIQAGDIRTLREVVLTLQRGDGLSTSALICDRQGKVLCHTSPEKEGTVIPELSSPGIATTSMEVRRPEGSFLQVTTPLFQGNELYGAFRAELSMTLLQREEAAVFKRALWVGALFLFLGALAAFWLSWTIAAPIEKLTLMVDEVSRGNFDLRSGLTCPGDLGALSVALDRMISKISKATKYQRAHSSSLERRMEAGTKTLAIRSQELLDARKIAKNAQELTKEGSRATDELLMNVNQETRTAVNAILGMVDLVLDTQLLPEQREYVKLARESAQELMVVLKNILQFTKLDPGEQDVLPIGFQLRDLVGDMLKLLGVRAREKGIELVCQIDPEVPDTLVGDPDRLRQILLNISGNGIKFTQGGEVVLRVEKVSQSPSDARLHFAVRDTGIGIPKEKEAEISQALSRDGSPMAEHEGRMAQGLTLAAELAKMMRGKIWFESEEGKGTTFHFTAYFSLPSENAGMPKEAGRKEVCGLSALVLEDNEACRAVLGEMLARWEVKVDLVESAQVAMKLLEKASTAGEPYDVVIMDEDLPETDGIVLAQRMGEKQGHFGALVVLLGSAGEPAEAAQWKDLGAAACVTKPVKESELLHALTELSAAAPSPT